MPCSRMRPLLEDQDAVGVDHGGESMGDDHGGAILGHRRERLLDGLFGVAVERRGGLVEHQDARTLEDRPGDGDPLLLPARELQAALAHHRLPAVGQRLDEGPDVGHLGGLLDLGPTRVRASVEQVVVDALVEQHRVLGDDPDGGAQARLAHRADVLSIDQDAPAGEVVEPEQQPAEGRLAGSAMPYHRQGGPRRDLEAQILEDRPLGLVVEAHAIKDHLARTRAQGGRARAVLHLGGALEELEHQVHVRQGVFDLPIDNAQEPERDEELQQQRVHQDEIPHGQVPGHHALGRQHQQQGHADGDDGALTEVEQGHGGLALDGHLLPPRKGRIVAGELGGLVAEILDRLVVDEAVDGLGVGLGVEPVHLVTVVHPPLGDGEGEGDVEPDRAEGHQRKHRRIAADEDGRD